MVLRILLDLQAKNGINIMATSRIDEDISKHFSEDCLSKQIHADEDDVRPYIDEQMKLLDDEILDNNLRERIRTEVAMAAEGM